MDGQAQETAPRNILRRMVVTLAAVACLTATVLMAASAVAAERVALVIGNSAYKTTSELKNPRSDAEAIAAALERLGFLVLKDTDADQEELRRLARSFARELETAKVALFFYAGHGLQLNGKNYLVPVDAKLESEADIDFEAMDVNFILRQMERKDGTSIVLLDACRNNPLSTKLASNMGERSAFLGRGLARIESGVGTFIGFATQPNNVAYDGKGEHSPFTEGLLKHIETPGLDIEIMMRRVREDVIGLTGGLQVPWSNSSLVGDRVVLNPASLAAEEPGTPAVPQIIIKPAEPEEQPANERDVEVALWNSVKDSGDPAVLDDYLEAYPDGSFADHAKAMIEELEEAESPEEASRSAPLPRRKPLANLAPRDELEDAPESAPQVETAPARKKPAAKKKKPARQKAIAPQKQSPKKARRKSVPQKSVSQGENCDFCYACMSESLTCRRTWVCGKRYQDRLAQGLCVWRR